MTEKNNKTTILQPCLAKNKSLTELINYSDDSIVSKTILDKPSGTITLFAFDKDQKLSEHTAPYDAVVQIIDGSAHLKIANDQLNVSAGQIVIMPANVPHAVIAEQKFKMLLTMIRT